MRTYGLAVFVIVSLIAGVSVRAAGGDAKEGAVTKDLEAFKGSWRLISREVDGKKSSEEEIKDMIVTHDGLGKFSCRRGDKVIGAGSYKLDPTTKPRTIDVSFTEGEHRGKTGLGIYEIDGDTFRVCCARPGDGRSVGGRPADFSARGGTGRILIVFKRKNK
jgi:uncharacterized protein (TIGR03067 family)